MHSASTAQRCTLVNKITELHTKKIKSLHDSLFFTTIPKPSKNASYKLPNPYHYCSALNKTQIEKMRETIM